MSGVKSSERIKKPNVSHDPNSLLIRLLFLPIQPKPASSAHAFSKRGDVSTQIFHLQFGTSVFGATTLPSKSVLVTGSGFSNSFRFFTNDTDAGYSVNGMFVSFIAGGRR